MRLVLLGAPRGLAENRWKNCLQEGAEALGWQVVHLHARTAPVDDVVRLCRSADLFIWARTHNNEPAGCARTMLRRIEDAGVPTVGIHMDLYWGIPHRQKHIGRHPWWSCQYVFTADGGGRPWRERGVNHRWLPPAAGPRFLGRGVVDQVKMWHPVVFVGDVVGHIHGPHRAALLDWAQRRYGPAFFRYGKFRPIWGARFSDLCASAQVVLGDSAPAAGGMYWSDRVVLTLSRGGLLAHPRTAGMAGWGITDEVAILFDRFGFDALGERIDGLTVRERRRMSDNALTLISERHMWQHRLEHVAEVVFGAGDRGVRGVDGEVGRPAAAAASAAG